MILIKKIIQNIKNVTFITTYIKNVTKTNVNDFIKNEVTTYITHEEPSYEVESNCFKLIKQIIKDKNGNILGIFNGEKNLTEIQCHYWIYKAKNSTAIDILLHLFSFKTPN